MAKLPTYERQVLKTDIGPAVGTQNLEGNIRQSQALQKLFDQATAWAGEEAIKYSVERATQDFLDQPLTVKDYQDAMRRGEDPIARFKRGGVSYNETLKKLHGHQARMELGSQTQALQEDVLARVKRGELTDPNQIRKELEAPIRGYGKTVSAIDVEQGMSYISTARTHSKYYYKSAMKELGDHAEAEMQLKVRKYVDDNKRYIEAFLDTENDPGLIIAQRDFLIKNAADSFKLTGNVEKNLNSFVTEVDKVMFAKIGDKIALENYTRMTKDDLLSKMQTGNDFGLFTNYYNQLTADDRNSLDSAVTTAMNNLDTKKSTADALVTKKIGIAKTQTGDGSILDLNKEFSVDDITNMTPPQALDYSIVALQNDINTKMKNGNIDSAEALRTHYRQKYAGEQNTLLANAALKQIEKNVNDMRSDIEKNPVDWAQTNTLWKKNIEPLFIDPNKLNDQGYILEMQRKFAQRQTTVQSIANKNQSANINTFFSTQEVKYYEAQFENISAADISADEKINRQLALATSMVNVFQGNSYLLFKEFSKNTAYAHLGNLASDALRSPTPNMDNVKLLAKGYLIEQGVSGDKTKYDFAANSDELVNTTMLGNALPSAERGIVTANAKRIYMALNDKDPFNFNKKLYQQALSIAVGTNGEYGGLITMDGHQHIIPSSIKREHFKEGLFNYVDINDVNSVLVNSRGENIENIGDGGEPYSLDQFRNANFRFVSNNKIAIIGEKVNWFSPNEQKEFSTPDGKPIYVDVEALYQIILAKNPHFKTEKPSVFKGIIP